jgi:hypothetical protein
MEAPRSRGSWRSGCFELLIHSPADFKPNQEGERCHIYQMAQFPKSVARDIGESSYIAAACSAPINSIP